MFKSAFSFYVRRQILNAYNYEGCE